MTFEEYKKQDIINTLSELSDRKKLKQLYKNKNKRNEYHLRSVIHYMFENGTINKIYNGDKK